MSRVPDGVREAAARIRLLVLDVDGVLTDGTLWYGPDGEYLKAFHVRDGLGIRLLRPEGIGVAVLSARRSPALERRVADLGIEHVVLGRDDKRAALGELLSSAGVDACDAACVGDDVLDVPVMRGVGLAIAPADAHALARAEAAWVTEAPGGRGAVREVADGLLDARGRLSACCEALIGTDVG
ncbi:MAG: KdsC family phosphatase [Polyangiales bacterium]